MLLNVQFIILVYMSLSNILLKFDNKDIVLLLFGSVSSSDLKLSTILDNFNFVVYPSRLIEILRVSLPKTGPLPFGSENQFPLNFAHEYILVQK